MTKTKRKIFETKPKAFVAFALSVLFLGLPSASHSAETPSAFNLMTVIDNFLNLDNDTKSAYETQDETTKLQQAFYNTTKKFNQGNISVAYNDYAKIISELDSDMSLFVAAKTMYKQGFFTLGDVALSKIKNQTFFSKHTEILKQTYKGDFPLDKQEEVFLAKAYASIYFDNTPEETAFDLSKKTNLLEKSDYANYVMAQALTESRQYQQALMFVETAIQKNPKNPEYIAHKLEILTRAKKYKEAFKFLAAVQNSSAITPEYQTAFEIQKEKLLAEASNNDSDKKFHSISAIYLDGNYYKAINECKNVLNFNKNNPKILTLQAQSQININQIEPAKKNLEASYALDKNYTPTLISLGDIALIEKQPQKALDYYKKAQKLSKDDPSVLIRLSITCAQIPEETKTLVKTEKSLKNVSKNLFYEYYLIATGIYKNDPQKRREYLVKSLSLNPLFHGSLHEYLAYLSDTNRIAPIQNLLNIMAFSDTLDYAYYYFKGISEKRLGLPENALTNAKRSLALNPDFEPASSLILDLTTSTI